MMSTQTALMSFNPRAHGRRDWAIEESLLAWLWFQSTRPREARRSWEIRPQSSKSFNPRAHGRRDF